MLDVAVFFENPEGYMKKNHKIWIIIAVIIIIAVLFLIVPFIALLILNTSKTETTIRETEIMEFADNSEHNQPHTANYFDTVTDCKIIDVDFGNAKTSEDKIHTIPVKYTITYNEDFKEENGLKKGENALSATISIKENSAGYLFICDVENNIE